MNSIFPLLCFVAIIVINVIGMTTHEPTAPIKRDTVIRYVVIHDTIKPIIVMTRPADTTVYIGHVETLIQH